MGTLYVASLPAGGPEDITFRTLRVLRDASLVVAADPAKARRQLDLHQLSARLDIVTEVDPAHLGGDFVLLLDGWQSAPTKSERALIDRTLEAGHSVVALPGPTLACTALVVSGLPSDSFLYLGELPPDSRTRRDLLNSVACERRTLVALESAQRVTATLAEIAELWGDRPLAAAMPGDLGLEAMWRGRVKEALAVEDGLPGGDRYALVFGGSREVMPRWDEDRLGSAIQDLLREGLGTKQVSHRLAAESGWTRREVYRLVVESGRFPPDEQV
jgi:16S rRNA (cytidine1402-2'-O)-methyltransferase